jgi:uncharacterized protein
VTGEFLKIQRCARCGTKWFPERLGCGRCGGRTFSRIPAGPGTLEEVMGTLGSVRLDAGPVVIARVDPGTSAGSRVLLERHERGQTWARNAPSNNQ